MAENRNFGRISKFWPKIEILAENRNFSRKSKFWPKIEIMAKNRNFGRKSKFYPKIEILAENRNFGRKSKFWLKIEIFVHDQNFGLNSCKRWKFWDIRHTILNSVLGTSKTYIETYGHVYCKLLMILCSRFLKFVLTQKYQTKKKQLLLYRYLLIAFK